MKLEKCIINTTEISDKNTGSITLPKGVFSNIPLPCKFIAIKKKKGEFIKIIPIAIEKDNSVYDIYCEVEDNKTIVKLLEIITKISLETKDITFLSEMIGICSGTKKGDRCTFNGFVVITGDEANALDLLNDGFKKLDIKILTINKVPE